MDAYSSCTPSTSIPQSNESIAQRKLINYLRAECTRLIILDHTNLSHSTQADDRRANDIATLLSTARINIAHSIQTAVSEGKFEDKFDIEKTERLRAELPGPYVMLDDDFRRWTETVTCPVRWDVEMIAA